MNIKLAALQLENSLGDIPRSFYEAEAYIKKASQDKCDMVFLPELSTCGYIPNQNIWQYAEPLFGPTVKWATSMALQYNIYIGAGFCECDGKDFYNSYLIANPQGQIDGIVRKSSSESYCFKSSGRNPIIKTAIANIAIGICADNHYAWFYKKLLKEDFDLLIMPHASPGPSKVTKTIKESDIEAYSLNLKNLVKLYSDNFDVPVVFVNAVGNFPRMQGLLGRILIKNEYKLSGESIIVSPDNKSSALGQEAGLTQLEVSLKENKKARVEKIKSYFGVLYPGNFITRKIIIPFDILIGDISYRKSRKRKKILKIMRRIIDKNK